LSDDKKRKLYDQYGIDGVNAADQMGEDQASAHFGPGGVGGGPRTHHFTHGFPGGGGFGGIHMSDAEAQQFFAQFFGQPQRPRVKRFDAIPNGTVVSLKGLLSHADRNGDRGEITDYDPSSGRYTVQLEDSDELLRVKAANLLQHVHVNLQGIESQTALNGQQGTIIAFDDHKERYNIYVMNMSKVVSLKPTNVILKNGTVAKITGLSAKPELNSKFGTIKAWIRETNRYDIQLSESQVLRIKVDNVRV
jgi:curved DNA-binding protein CbpA